ncbi:HEAT repeat domain-containing protein [Myroides marinus]|uniref:hypothetical protein n=1 Tax=Myroides marinus TaxID=703342 RepID=UPI002578BA14|nr:hypothetical protein [Myroides marinus]MDM1347481.1 HEAT repeat domain-containing protein [Myroides marinus]MDM1351010.1 HEAT repeat domain-containing protein [Myroides marinus]MDM1355322.1 HEAT repeat domain-containing protein [Myroides marinus]MDM1358234.1 HEAT repeat domain-containing protein [Myroides marinus]MDM1362101.1 HEAT repeat domain-containing protein [Myroides marinus]
MKVDDALMFLREHQPMPSDEFLTEELLKKYDEVRAYFYVNIDKRCIPLFLNSFGFIDGYGVYQLVEDVIFLYDPVDVIPYLKEALSSDIYSIRYWCLQIASSFPSEDLLLPVNNILMNDDFDLKYCALAFFEVLNSPLSIDLIEGFTFYEKNNELLEYAYKVLSSMSS